MSVSLKVVADSISAFEAKKIVNVLKESGCPIVYLGDIALMSDIDNDLTIYNQLKEKLTNIGSSDVLLGITSTGNSVAIYSNKVPGFVTAPILEVKDVEISIKEFKANSFDVAVKNPNIKLIVNEILKRMDV